MSTTPETRAAAVALYATGAPASAVAARYSVSPTSVVAWVRKAGGEVRNQGNQMKPDDSLTYRGGWVRDGLVWRPAKPSRRPSVLSVGMGQTCDNGTARTGASTPAGPHHHLIDLTERRG